MSDNGPGPEDVPWVYDKLEAQLPRDDGKAKQQKKEEEPKGESEEKKSGTNGEQMSLGF